MNEWAEISQKLFGKFLIIFVLAKRLRYVLFTSAVSQSMHAQSVVRAD